MLLLNRKGTIVPPEKSISIWNPIEITTVPPVKVSQNGVHGSLYSSTVLLTI
jgi:hypothetical protein